MTRTEQQQAIRTIKSAANSAKSRLIDLIRSLEEVSPTEARKLEKIVIKLEVWQNQ